MSGPGTPLETWRDRSIIPAPGRCWVKVNASSLNFHDNVESDGLLPGPWPRVPMSDGAGEVVAVGPGVDALQVGQRGDGGGSTPGWLDGPPDGRKLTRELPRDSERRLAAAVSRGRRGGN